MPRVDPLQNAIAAYAADKWSDTNWRVFGRETGTSDIIDGHPRLYRSLGFGDDDYPDAAAEVVRQILASEAVEDDSGEAGRMGLFADSMPDLPTWTESSAPARTRACLVIGSGWHRGCWWGVSVPVAFGRPVRGDR